MNVLKKFYTREKKQMKHPETALAVWIAVGFIIGVGMDNIGAGVAIGVAIGAAMYATKKKAVKESLVDENDVYNNKDII